MPCSATTVPIVSQPLIRPNLQRGNSTPLFSVSKMPRYSKEPRKMSIWTVAAELIGTGGPACLLTAG